MFAVGVCFGCIIGVFVVIAKDEEIEKKHERRRMYSQLLVRGDQMMDAVDFVKEWKRACKSFGECASCTIQCGLFPRELTPEEVVKTIEDWSRGHPKRTRLSKLLENYPNANFRSEQNNTINICPRMLDRSFECPCISLSCEKCKEEYWLGEAE